MQITIHKMSIRFQGRVFSGKFSSFEKAFEEAKRFGALSATVRTGGTWWLHDGPGRLPVGFIDGRPSVR